MPQDPNATDFQWDIVEVPLARGVDPRDPVRSAEASSLLVAENVRFSDGNFGLERRRGHRAWGVRTTASLSQSAVRLGGAPGPEFSGSGGTGIFPASPDAPLTPSAGWLFGVGPFSSVDDSAGDSPDAGYLAGVATAGTERLLWDGWRMFSLPGGEGPGTSGGGFTTPAVMPVARTRPLGKHPTPMNESDVAVGPRHTVVTALLDGVASLSVYDSVTGAPIVQETGLADVASPLQVRAVPCGDWIHIFVASATSMAGYSVHAGDPWNVRDFDTALPDCDTHFDVRRLTDDTFALCVRDTSDAVRLYLFNADGTENPALSAGTSLPLGGNPARRVAIARHQVTGRWCLAWEDTSGVLRVGEFTQGGAANGAVSSGGSIMGLTNLTVEARYRTTANKPVWSVFTSEDSGGTGVPTVKRWGFQVGALSATATRLRAALTHHAFRVGDRVFAVVRHEYEATYRPGVQSAFYAVDDSLNPVARLEYGTAGNGRTHGLHGVHFDGGQGDVNRTRLHAGLVHRLRVDSRDNDQFDEDSLKALSLDFLPALRHAEFGRSTYFPGGLLHAYDGREVAEAGFLHWPEKVRAGVIVGGGTGALANGAVHRYRVRAVYKDHRGQETLSAGLLTDEVTVPAGPSADRTIRITVPTLQWSRRDLALVGFLVYRNESSGTLWYLVSSRDPANANWVANDPAVNEVTWDDAGAITDAVLLTRERDPGNAGALEPFSPAASEVIGSGRDRLWLSGGEIPAGDVLPSLTRVTDANAAFNGFLTTTVSPGSEVTAFGFMGHSALVFSARSVHAFEADGPTNTGAGAFDTPRVVVTDVGAVPGSPVAMGPPGLFFVSEAGPCLLATNFQVQRIGDRVRALSDGVVGIVSVPSQREMRFYRRSGPALVFVHDRGEWIVWTGLEAQGAVSYGDGALIARADGRAWWDAEGVWTDDRRGYVARVRTAFLGPGIDAFQRVRRVSVTGDLPGTGVVLKFRAYYDDRTFPEDQWSWEPDEDPTVATGAWGDGTWGDGAWGDPGFDEAASTAALDARRDRVLRVRRGLSRQKCQRVSIEWRDNAPANAGARFSSIALEVGRRGGLKRGPHRTF